MRPDLTSIARNAGAAISSIVDAHVSVLAEGDRNGAFEALTMEPREDPSEHAQMLHGVVSKVVGVLERPEGVLVQVLPVQRVMWNGRAYHEAKARKDPLPAREQETAVVVRFVCEGRGERVLIVSCE